MELTNGRSAVWPGVHALFRNKRLSEEHAKAVSRRETMNAPAPICSPDSVVAAMRESQLFAMSKL